MLSLLMTKLQFGQHTVCATSFFVVVGARKDLFHKVVSCRGVCVELAPSLGEEFGRAAVPLHSEELRGRRCLGPAIDT